MQGTAHARRNRLGVVFVPHQSAGCSAEHRWTVHGWKEDDGMEEGCDPRPMLGWRWKASYDRGWRVFRQADRIGGQRYQGICRPQGGRCTRITGIVAGLMSDVMFPSR